MQKLDDEHFDDDQSRQLADALRAALEANAPTPSARLRAAVEQQLALTEDEAMTQKNDAKQPASASQSARRLSWWPLAVSLCLLIGAGGLLWYVNRPTDSELAQRDSDEGDGSVEPEGADQRFALDSRRSHFTSSTDGAAAPMSGDSREPKVTRYNGHAMSKDSTAQLPTFSPADSAGGQGGPGGGESGNRAGRPLHEPTPPLVFEKALKREEEEREGVGINAPTLGFKDEQTQSIKESVREIERTRKLQAANRGLTDRTETRMELIVAGEGPGLPPAINDAINALESSELPASEEYAPIHENAFLPVTGETAVSTFSIDVDTASYSNVRRYLRDGMLPPPDAVRIEELVNYFTYDYPQPEGKTPFSVNMELAGCPWNDKHQLLRVALKGKEISAEQRPAGNLVFLLDVSGSMQSHDKLPLLKEAMKLLVGELRKDDRVAIVTYAGNAGLVLDSTPGSEPIKIRDAIDALRAGGSTNGSAGIQLAYEKAIEHYVDGGINRVILATDGDLNVGVTNDDDLVTLIKDKAASGVFLSVLGFGTGNLKDGKLEKLADNGNGQYAYIDNLKEAQKVLVEQVGGSLVTIAKDVKLQLEFNPAEVRAYRLLGYENRMLATRDFDDDTKDAGEIGAEHTVTALYELVPKSSDEAIAGLDAPAEKPQPLKYQLAAATDQAPEAEPKADAKLTEAAKSGELLTLALRYKEPEGVESTKIDFTLPAKAVSFNRATPEFQFAASVASFGMLLRHSKHAGSATFAAVEEIAGGAIGQDPHGRRAEFLELVRSAERLSK